MNLGTLDALRERLNCRIFLTCKSREVYDLMLRNAVEEGYAVPEGCFGAWDIVALARGRRALTWGGTFFHMEYNSPGNIYRVDYGKYIAGEPDFLCHDYKGTGTQPAHTALTTSFTGTVIISGENYIKAKHYYLEHFKNFDTPQSERGLLRQMENMFAVLVVM